MAQSKVVNKGHKSYTYRCLQFYNKGILERNRLLSELLEHLEIKTKKIQFEIRTIIQLFIIMYKLCFVLLSTIFAGLQLSCQSVKSSEDRPNIILVMSDDQGWGQVGYYNHPILKTPNLDKMAKNGLRLDRFYAGAPVCSPTRASVLTGRVNDRTAVFSHGEPMRIQEKTIAQALKGIGYNTAHFGKWHLDGLLVH